MISLLLSLALAQAPAAPKAPGVVVLIANQKRLTPLEADGLADRIASALSAAKIPVMMSPGEARQQLGRPGALKCAGKPLCVAAAARELGAAAVVGVEAERFFGEIGLTLYLITTDGTAPIVEDSIVVSPTNTSEIDTAAVSFAERARAALSVFPEFAPPKPPPAAVKPPDVPRVEPAPPPPPKPLVLAPPAALPPKPSGPPAMAYVTGGGAVATAAAAGVFGFLAYQSYSQLKTGASVDYSGYDLSGLSYSEYQAMQTNAAVTAIAGGACVALTSAAIYFFLQGGPPAR